MGPGNVARKPNKSVSGVEPIRGEMMSSEPVSEHCQDRLGGINPTLAWGLDQMLGKPKHG